MELPDALFFGAGFTTGSGRCKAELALLHNPTFAGYLVQAAGSNQTLLEFALVCVLSLSNSSLELFPTLSLSCPTPLSLCLCLSVYAYSCISVCLSICL
jgi:hypothetical protein